MTIMHGDPPEDGAIWLDDNHAYVLLRAHDSDEYVAITEWHRTPAGQWCAGYVPFKSAEREYGWDVHSLDPLHLEPSLLCRACQCHGWIRGGTWVQA